MSSSVPNSPPFALILVHKYFPNGSLGSSNSQPPKPPTAPSSTSLHYYHLSITILVSLPSKIKIIETLPPLTLSSSKDPTIHDPSNPGPVSRQTMSSSSGPPTASSNSGRLIDFLVQPDRYYPIFKNITLNLGAADMMTLRRVSTSLNVVYLAAQASQWNINTALQRFVKNSKLFRNKLGQASGIISGQFALDFLDRSPVGDRLDVFASGKMGGFSNGEFLAWAIDSEGYAELPSYRNDKDRKFRIDQHMTNVYARPGTDKPLIYLHHTWKTPIVDLFTTGRQYTLALANFITSTKVYVPFAKETFRERRAYLHKPIDTSAHEYLTPVAHTGRRLLDVRHRVLE
ncbi:uncharacterized protein BDZ99DRAFT_514060 [Mytilinidion resinicola]|uniref:Uncharacterized protein n=1 Tax=Mytilinidion resinicola TaxID=574789 RepID=A0A6A6ZA05_9PEZI|nr:uncharacterized protein BDZ99DRAFT_514060 [Mytilinidion resinicola]KAF2817846.1 hypothetical protein BDZ99DRAFT_514060 [Mytilinidion resinicola]